MSKHGNRRGRRRRRAKKKRYGRPSVPAAARDSRKASAVAVSQRPVTEADLDRLGEYAIDKARAANERRYQKRLVRSIDGQLYYRMPHGQLVKTDGKAVVQADGTLRPLPPAPRPTKRERAKEKRRLKRKEREK